MSPDNEYRRSSLRVLETALAEVPGYATWRHLDPGPTRPLDERYAALPALTKRELRDHFPLGFVPRSRDLESGLAAGDILYAQTSGSTADRITLVFHPGWWEESERAAWQLNAHARRVADGDRREAVVASPRCVGPGYSPRPLTMAARTLGRHLYLNQTVNPASWSDGDVRRMVREMNEFAPAVLEGDPAYLAPLARRAGELGLAVSQPRLIFLTYSYPSRIYLRQIRSLFTAPIASSYGSTETGHVFMECEAGLLHQNVEHCRVDFQPWRPEFGGPARGHMLVTVFHNPWFVALRFDVGDVARLHTGTPCRCGRSAGLTLETIEGRVSDVFTAADGRIVTVDDLDAALAAQGEIAGWQIDRPSANRAELRLLLAPAAGSAACRRAAKAVRDATGGLRVDARAVRALRHEPSGKFRFCRSARPVDHSRLWREQP